MRRVLLPQTISDEAVPPGAVPRHFSGLSMGTSWTVHLLDNATPGRAASVDLQQGLQQQLDLVVAQMSHWSEDSDLGRFNRAEPGSWHSLPAAFCEVLGFAMHVSQASGGAYDPCAGALVSLWGFGPRNRYDEPGFLPPKDDTVALLLSQRQRCRLELDLPARRARQPGGLQLDLSAVAKGYGVDRLARYLTARASIITWSKWAASCAAPAASPTVSRGGSCWNRSMAPIVPKMRRIRRKCCWRCTASPWPRRATTGVSSRMARCVFPIRSIRAAACRSPINSLPSPSCMRNAWRPTPGRRP